MTPWRLLLKNTPAEYDDFNTLDIGTTARGIRNFS
jgi:hypothetical protein